jgi:hypothetical protein
MGNRQRVSSSDATDMPKTFMKSRRETGMGHLLLKEIYMLLTLLPIAMFQDCFQPPSVPPFSPVVSFQ